MKVCPSGIMSDRSLEIGLTAFNYGKALDRWEQSPTLTATLRVAIVGADFCDGCL